MTCENCIHYDICNEQADGNIVELMKEPCFRFVNRDNIVLLPCKIGDTVYVIRECSCYTYSYSDCQKRSKRCQEKVYLGQSRRKHHCGCVARAKFELKHITALGKKVFLTQEEAETALYTLNKTSVAKT